MRKDNKLTARDLAFGIGRVATDEELKSLMATPFGKGKTSEQVLNEAKTNLQEKRNGK